MQRVRIENKIIEIVRACKFYAVSRDVSTKLVRPINRSDSSILPSTILTRETRCKYERNKRMGMRDAQKKSDWTWELLLEWVQEVTIEALEESLVDKAIWIPRNKAEGLKAVRLTLVSCVTTHPVEQQSAKGTQAKLTFKLDEIS